MSRFTKAAIARNVSSNWIGLATNVLIGFFLSPFILHHLGDAAFGIWVLIFSLTGYYGVFDLGIRSSIIRFVSKFLATGDKDTLGKLISTSLFSYSCVGLFTLLLTFSIAPYLDTLFHISPEFHTTSRWLLLIVGSSVALGFPLGITGSILEGLQRFDILNGTGIAATLLRAVLIVAALRRGHGLLTLAFITVSIPLIVSVVRGIVVLRICPLPMGWRYVDRAMFRQAASYSSITFITIVAGRLKFKTDEIVIGSMMSAAAITYFNVGARIVDYAGEVVLGLAQIFVPMSSQSEAAGNMDGVRRIFVVGNRFCALAIFPICGILIILGQSIIEVWVGKKYIAQSYPVLVILILSITLMWAQGASTRILFGIGKHGTWAAVTLIEGIANVILSIILVRPFGIIGDSLGTAIPLFFSMVFFVPRHVCRRLNVRVGAYLREAYVLPLLLCIPLIATMLLMKMWFVPHTYAGLAVHLLTAALVYGAGLGWAFTSNRLTAVSQAVLTNAKLDLVPATMAVTTRPNRTAPGSPTARRMG
jgi:O-antigen/teichoic acid export membrane protein